MKLKPLVAASLVAFTALSSQAADIDWGAHDVFELSGLVTPAVGSFLDTYKFTLTEQSTLAGALVATGITFGSFGVYDETGTTALFSAAFGGTTAKSGTWLLDPGTYVYAIGGLASASAGYVLTSATVGVAAVPEPETYAMLLAGLGVVGFLARRRRFD
ncbi:FxDxF family PEP-CTERM protein [Roseateles violae]|uniref:FxDxF family PEP-CTERM protein n=1 Tax=Roseateles violae TaxID=3058042 RepID=A0ABT8DUS8_9BURK|nr:FxDxF family PEP-CTERM protein [Pelomonas sp. PFR6]MDN3921878.1 FxDxF family PEP-CTERM protein [Pelomonas sp. PFR6]